MMLDDAATDADVDAPEATACDGGLCETTNGASCGLAPHASDAPSVLAIVALMSLLAIWRRTRRVLGLAAAALLASSSVALANPPPAVDVVLREVPPPRRYVSLGWNPIPALALGKVSFDVVIAPFTHHALVLAPFYASTTTAPITVVDSSGNPSQLPQQRFEGFGGEIGYRYYFGLGGLRGFFLGPSFMLGSFTATAQDASKTQFLDYGVAIDAGYQALIAERVVVAAGVGAQYTFTDKTIPDQQFPANVYANNGLRPRLLLSVGWAF